MHNGRGLGVTGAGVIAATEHALGAALAALTMDCTNSLQPERVSNLRPPFVAFMDGRQSETP
jgi:hypothetical protein